MKREIIIICILIFFILGCNKETIYKDRFTLVPDTNRIDIEIGGNSKNLSQCIQYMFLNDSNYISVANRNRNSIEIYNLDAKKLFKEIVIKTEGSNSFYRSIGFVAKSMDTIIAVSQMPQLIGLINSKGEVMKKIFYSKDINGRNILMTIPFLGTRPFLIGNTLFLSQSYRADESSGIFTSVKQKHSYLNVKVNLATGECLLLPLIYPDELIGKDISGMHISRVSGFNEYLVYHFGIIDGLYVTHNNLSFEKKTIETNYKFKFPENRYKYNNDLQAGMRYGITRDEVQDIIYDTYRECYYLVVRKRFDSLDKNLDISVKYLYPDCFIIILDKYLKHMGDVYFPDNTYSFKMMFITSKGLFISEDNVNNPTFDEDFMRFKLFILEKIKNK